MQVTVFFTQEVADGLCKLEKKNNYKEVRSDFYKLIVERNSNDSWELGEKLNPGYPVPIIKYRMGGSAGYRMYCLLYIVNNQLVVASVYPKAGPYGRDNVKGDELKTALKQGIEAYKSQNLVAVTLDPTNKTITF